MVAKVEGGLASLQGEVEAACPALGTDIYPGRRRTAFFKKYAAAISKNCKTLLASLQ